MSSMHVISVLSMVTLLLLGLLNEAYGKTSFIKDLRTDVEFPPVNIHNVPGIPEGHLRPLGWQRKPEGKVREEKEPLSPLVFNTRYVRTGKPAVFRGILKGTQVMEKWEEDAYLKEKYGQMNVTITVKKELHQHTQRSRRRMLLRKFLLDYMYENWYLTGVVNTMMLHELPLPNLLSCGTYKDRLVKAELWMSSGGTASLLHSHGDHNLHCIIDGRKDIILIDPKHKDIFQYHETYPNSGSGHSPWDMEMINMFKFPKVAQTPWTYSTLWGGDCIFIPAGYLHQIRSYGRGISYVIQFAPSVDFDSSDCKMETKSKRRKKDKKEEKGKKDEDEKEEQLSLADVNLIWAYSEGYEHLSDKKLEPSSMRRILEILLRDGNTLHKNQFEHFYNEALEQDSDKPPASDVFHIMTPNDESETVSREEIMALQPMRLRNMCDIFNKMHQRVHDEL